MKNIEALARAVFNPVTDDLRAKPLARWNTDFLQYLRENPSLPKPTRDKFSATVKLLELTTAFQGDEL